jgi:dipeptidyl aminopeptidase/acylaminoacyl peptidase
MTDSLYHQQSRDQLLGTHPSKSLIYEFSNEFHVTAATPPGFLVHCINDPVVNIKNSIYYDNALKKNNIPEQLYLYATGGHGFGLNNPSSPVKWFDIMMPWLQTQGFVAK